MCHVTQGHHFWDFQLWGKFSPHLPAVSSSHSQKRLNPVSTSFQPPLPTHPCNFGNTFPSGGCSSFLLTWSYNSCSAESDWWKSCSEPPAAQQINRETLSIHVSSSQESWSEVLDPRPCRWSAPPISEDSPPLCSHSVPLTDSSSLHHSAGLPPIVQHEVPACSPLAGCSAMEAPATLCPWCLMLRWLPKFRFMWYKESSKSCSRLRKRGEQVLLSSRAGPCQIPGERWATSRSEVSYCCAPWLPLVKVAALLHSEVKLNSRVSVSLRSNKPLRAPHEPILWLGELENKEQRNSTKGS